MSTHLIIAREQRRLQHKYYLQCTVEGREGGEGGRRGREEREGGEGGWRGRQERVYRMELCNRDRMILC